MSYQNYLNQGWIVSLNPPPIPFTSKASYRQQVALQHAASCTCFYCNTANGDGPKKSETAYWRPLVYCFAVGVTSEKRHIRRSKTEALCGAQIITSQWAMDAAASLTQYEVCTRCEKSDEGFEARLMKKLMKLGGAK